MYWVDTSRFPLLFLLLLTAEIYFAILFVMINPNVTFLSYFFFFWWLFFPPTVAFHSSQILYSIFPTPRAHAYKSFPIIAICRYNPISDLFSVPKYKSPEIQEILLLYSGYRKLEKYRRCTLKNADWLTDESFCMALI